MDVPEGYLKFDNALGAVPEEGGAPVPLATVGAGVHVVPPTILPVGAMPGEPPLSQESVRAHGHGERCV